MDLTQKPKNSYYDSPSYVEKLATQFGDQHAIELANIEHESEHAREILHSTRPDVLQKILLDFGLPVIIRHDIALNNNGSILPAVLKGDLMLAYISMNMPEGGHFAAAVVKVPQRQLVLYDSMCSSCGPHTYFPNILRAFRQLFPGFTIVQFTPNFYQPSGGFCDNKRGFPQKVAKVIGKQPDWDLVYKAHQFDAMSQHHFCYVEAIVFLSHMVFGTTMGPAGASRLEDRLIFIKKVVWGLIKKYTAKKLHPNFCYIMHLGNVTYKNGYTVPSPGMTLAPKHFSPPAVTKTTTLADIIRISS
jgi:hypothetical protein